MKHLKVILILALCFLVGIFAAIYIKNKTADTDVKSPLGKVETVFKQTFTNQPT